MKDLLGFFKPLTSFIDKAYNKKWLMYLLVGLIGFGLYMVMRG